MPKTTPNPKPTSNAPTSKIVVSYGKKVTNTSPAAIPSGSPQPMVTPKATPSSPKVSALSDLLFDPQGLTPERVDALPKVFKEAIQQGKFTPEHGVRLQAIVRNKAANHDRLVHQLNAAQTRIDELEKSLKEYEQSSPDNVPAGSKAKTGSKGFMEDAASELEALDKRFA